MKIRIANLIKKEIVITLITIILVTVGLSGFIYSYYKIVKEGEPNAIEIADFIIELCESDELCAGIATGLGNVVGTTNNATVQSQVFPTEDNIATSQTPYKFVIRNTGEMDAVISLKASSGWESESIPSASMMNSVGYKNVKLGYKVLPSETISIKTLNNENIFNNLFIPAGSYKIIEVWIWGSEYLENDAIGKFVVTKLSVVGEYKPVNPNNLFVYESEFAYTGSAKTYTTDKEGYYKIELWGAQGGSYSSEVPGGDGAYTSGIIKLTNNESLNFYVGQQAPENNSTYNAGGWNGGGNSGYNANEYSQGGGGSTDVRMELASSNLTIWNNNTSLNSRIMVAAGGAGNVNKAGITKPCFPGAGGGLIGYEGFSYSGSQYNDSLYAITGGGQTVAGVGYGSGRIGGFGYAFQRSAYSSGWGGGGGGGYYGGANGVGRAGAGGSSYISGHAGCIAIAQGNTSTPRAIKSGCNASSTTKACSTHYSGKEFEKTLMIDGNGYMWTTSRQEQIKMPSPNGGFYSLGEGHKGDGYAKIKYLGSSYNKNMVSVRYIKDCINGNTVNSTNRWVEIQALQNGINVALNKTVSGTVPASNQKPYTIITDGDINDLNYAQATSGTQCVTVDLEKDYSLDEIKVWHYYSDGRTYTNNETSVKSSSGSEYAVIMKQDTAETSSGKSITAYDNLLVNGSLELANNTNFSDWGYGSDGYLYNTSSSDVTLNGSQFVNINTNKKYLISATMKASNANATHYIGFDYYENPELLISPHHVMYLDNTLTTLTKDLKPGDTVVYLNDLTNWVNTTAASATYQRGFIFWNYTDSYGYQWPIETYSRNSYLNLYENASINKANKVITLSSPWPASNGIIPKGTQVSQSNSSNQNYILRSGNELSTSWTVYAGIVDGISNSWSDASKFRYGTRYVKFFTHANYNSTASTTTYIKDISIRELK